ncbi:MAG: aminopeptidase [Chitinophagaceae bacterium]|nr:aminopeptidase [Chitinophagaceae bacterium]
MKKVLLYVFFALSGFVAFAQSDAEVANPQLKKANEEKARIEKAEQRKKLNAGFSDSKMLSATDVKNQGMTGTCWCFSTTSLIESQCLKNNLGSFDLSEMFSVRNTYLEKAKNYILRQGHAQFSEGGLGHDLINAIEKYGVMPESVYSGLKPISETSTNSHFAINKDKADVNAATKPTEQQVKPTAPQHNHVKLVASLKQYLDSILQLKPVPENWVAGYEAILNTEMGTPPAKFIYNGQEYTPKTFASNVLKFNANDYVYITSFTHHPYYAPFIIEVPDNFSNGAYYNLPLSEMLQLTKEAVNKGVTVLWDADVSNDGFAQQIGYAYDMSSIPEKSRSKKDMINGEVKEGKIDADKRQLLFENLTTQDDHLMHIVGSNISKDGKYYFNVKNSWGEVGPFQGFINVSEAYFAMNTISLVIPKTALSKAILEKLKLK